jgi:uncharacterized protein (TIGR03792 family)
MYRDQPNDNYQEAAIELLEFWVAPADRADFLAIDLEIWTTALSKYPAFQRKEIWLDPQQPEMVTIIIYWSSRQGWKDIPTELLAALAEEFEQKFSRPYQLVREREFVNYPVI